MAGGALAQNAGTVTNHAFALGKGVGTTGYTSLLCTSAQLAVGQSAADPICKTITGDVTITAAGATAIGSTKVTSAMLNADVFSTAHSWGGQQTFTAPILGTPASGTLTNETGLPISTGVSGLGTSVATFLATPSSANLRAALTDEVGTGAAYFVGGALGTPASGTLTNATGLPLSGLAAQSAWTFVVNNTSGSASPTAQTIDGLTSKASPVAADELIIWDVAGSALKKASVSSIASAGSVASIAGNTGAFTLSTGITNSTNDIRADFASKSDQQTGTSTSKVVGTAHQQDHDSAAKAWVNFIGSSGSVNASYNVTSVTRSGSGVYVVNLTTAFASANYSCVTTSEQSSGTTGIHPWILSKTASAVSVDAVNFSGAAGDPVNVNMVCYGRQ